MTSKLSLKQIGLYCVLFLGIYLRLMDYLGGHWPYYVHDRDRHVEYIRYVNATGLLPPPDAGIEFPQQPLYYFLASVVYQPSQTWQVNDAVLAAQGLLIAILGLGIVVLSLKYISSWLVKYVMVVYLSLTPSFILAAPFIGNDGMVQVAGFYLFFCALRFNRNPGSRGTFLLLVLALLLALFSKLNAVSLVLVCPWVLWRIYLYLSTGKWLLAVSQRAFLFGIAILFWTVVTWYHGELGRNGGGFKMVTTDKVGMAPMFIPDTGVNYLFSIHPLELFRACQASTLSRTPDSVRFSFPTFQYGTMLLGEHEYSHPPQLAAATGPLIIFGFMLLVGGVLFFVQTVFGVISILTRQGLNSWSKSISKTSLSILTLAVMAAGSLAVYYYVHGAPYTCNSDFRFEYPVLAWLGYGAGRGLAWAGRVRFVGYAITALLLAYAFSCVWLIHATYTYAFTDL